MFLVNLFVRKTTSFLQELEKLLEYAFKQISVVRIEITCRFYRLKASSKGSHLEKFTTLKKIKIVFGNAQKQHTHKYIIDE